MSSEDTQHDHGHEQPAASPSAHDEGHASDHSPHLAHHFHSPKQQFESGKLGMWVFLATEILMFGGLFCAYSIYRGNHQDVFLYGYGALDKFWGTTNTIVLLTSSLTMAWAVRAAQMGKQKLLMAMLIATFIGGAGFMCIKGIEYKVKWDHHLFPGSLNAFYFDNGQPKHEKELEHAIAFIDAKNTGGLAHEGGEAALAHGDEPAADQAEGETATAEATTPAPGATNEAQPRVAIVPAAFPAPADVSLVTPPPAPTPGVLDSAIADAGLKRVPSAQHTQLVFSSLPTAEQHKVHLFFDIYFLMTGLHGLHVLVGMGVILWLILRARKGHFSEEYFAPVDIGGLYWHLVDIIWIFLFPLLYLIH